MRLVRVKLTNVRVHRTLRSSCGDGVTGIIRTNAAGKSTILE